MKNILFLLLIILSFISAAFIAIKKQTFTTQNTREKPNILWITCKDMSPHLVSFGEKVAKTPNLDQVD